MVRKKKYEVYHKRMASIVFMLIKAPRTVAEIAEFLGMSMEHDARGTRNSSRNTIMRSINALIDEGLVKHVGNRIGQDKKRGRQPAVFAWIGHTLDSEDA